MCNLIEVFQISFPIVTMQMFPVFLKVFICSINFYFCFYLDDLDIRDYIGTAIDDIMKYKLLTNHFKPDHNYEFSSRFQHGYIEEIDLSLDCILLIFSI